MRAHSALTAANAATMRSSTAASLTLCTDEMEPSSCRSGLLSEMELAACLQLYAAWKSIKSFLVVVVFYCDCRDKFETIGVIDGGCFLFVL